MHYDVISLRSFYAARLGRQVFAVLSARLSVFWPAGKNDKNCRITAVGYGVPYLEKLWAGADITALMPAHLGVHRWSGTPNPNDANKTALIDEPSLPLADNSVDRVLLVHSLEHSSDPAGLLAEARRVLVPGGRLLVVVPNRLGWWSRSDQTAWGSGQPFSQTQLKTLVQEADLVPTRWTACLFLPPLLWRALAAFSPALLELTEKVGRAAFGRVCGLTIVEADKLVHAPVKGRKHKQHRHVLGGKPALAPNATTSPQTQRQDG